MYFNQPPSPSPPPSLIRYTGRSFENVEEASDSAWFHLYRGADKSLAQHVYTKCT